MQRWEAALLYFLLAGTFVFFAHVDWQALLNRCFIFNGFILFLWLTLPFSIDGTPLFTCMGLTFSRQGAVYASLIALKANALYLFTISLIGTTEPFTFAHALFHLKCPKKLVYIAIFLYRYVAVLHEEYERMLSAVRIRAFRAKTDIHTFRTLAYMIGMLFVNSYDRSQRIYQALQLRGFRGDFPMLIHFQWKRSDVIFAGLIGTLLVVQAALWT